MPRLILLLPPVAKFAGIALPDALGKALARADRAAADAGEEAQLARHFRPLPNRWPPAALARVADAGLEDAQAHGWLRADPAHIRPDINGARLLGTGRVLGLDQHDVDALLPALRPLFGDAGFFLDAPHPERWYLRLPRDTRLPPFAAPDVALGDDVFEHSPEGPDARRWRVLASEAQVTLHNHPHNAARLAAGKVPVNSLWFWGGGVLPDVMSGNFPRVFSDDPVVLGAARLANMPAMPPITFTAAAGGLLDLRSLRDPRALLDRWLLPAVGSVGEGDVLLDFTNGTQFTLRRGQRWRVWRKPMASLTA